MKLCPACDRHLFGPEPACPFCGAEQVTTAARAAGGALASITLAFALGTAACGPVVEPEQMEGSSSAGDETASTTTTTNDTTPVPTTGITTVELTTDDGPAMTSIEPASTSSSDSSDDNPCAFYAGCPPDVNGGPIECDIFAQDCPPDEKCMPWANDGGEVWNATRCTPIAADPDAPGDPCTVEGNGASGIDSCEQGVMCFHVDPETNEGTCVAMCSGSPKNPQCAAPEEACLFANEGVLALCLETCDPLAPACEAGMGCYPSPLGEDFFCLPTFDMPGVHGEPCEQLASCAPGHACVDQGALPACAGASCCVEYCDLTAGLPCPDDDQGVTCVPWYEDGMAPPGFENVGVCVLPL